MLLKKLLALLSYNEFFFYKQRVQRLTEMAQKLCTMRPFFEPFFNKKYI